MTKIRCPHDGCDCMSFVHLEGLNPRAVRHVAEGISSDPEEGHKQLDDLWQAVLADLEKDHPDDLPEAAEARLQRVKYVAREALRALEHVPTRWWA